MARTRISAAALYLPTGPHGGHRAGDSGAGQGAVLQQFERRRCRAGAARRIPRRPADRGDRQARQPLRRRHRRDAGRGLYSNALACDSVSAFGGIIAVNRPARRPDGGSDQRHLHRSGRRARRRRRGQGRLREEEEPAPAADRRLPDPGAWRPDREADHGWNPGAGPRQWPRDARHAQSGDKRAPTSRN
jgi:hypothetical protein